MQTQIERLTADNAALREALDLMVSESVHTELRPVLAAYELNESNSSGRVAHVHACRALAQFHPGAKLLEELTALRKVAEFAREITSHAEEAGLPDGSILWPMLTVLDGTLSALDALNTQEAPNAPTK